MSINQPRHKKLRYAAKVKRYPIKKPFRLDCKYHKEHRRYLFRQTALLRSNKFYNHTPILELLIGARLLDLFKFSYSLMLRYVRIFLPDEGQDPESPSWPINVDEVTLDQLIDFFSFFSFLFVFFSFWARYSFLICNRRRYCSYRAIGFNLFVYIFLFSPFFLGVQFPFGWVKPATSSPFLARFFFFSRGGSRV